MQESDRIVVQSINAGQVKNLSSDGDPVLSGIAKQPLPDNVLIDETGVRSDEIADPRYHGGPDQAIYVYSANDYDWWSAELDRDLEAGVFGENLTLDGLPSDLSIGDRLISGALVLEVTGPRIPCHKLGLVMNDATFPQHFKRAERPGAYCRVLNHGKLRSGDVVSLVANPDAKMTVLDMFRLYYAKPSSEKDLRRALSTPLAHRLREKFQARLQRVAAG